jgi:Protein of unknown function (DUF2569)
MLTLLGLVGFVGTAPLDATVTTILALSFAVTLLGVFAGIALWRLKPWAVRATMIYLLSLVLVPLASLFVSERRGAPSDAAPLLRSVIYAVVWTAYFSMSKRVKNTFDPTR